MSMSGERIRPWRQSCWVQIPMDTMCCVQEYDALFAFALDDSAKAMYHRFWRYRMRELGSHMGDYSSMFKAMKMEDKN